MQLSLPQSHRLNLILTSWFCNYYPPPLNIHKGPSLGIATLHANTYLIVWHQLGTP